VSPAYEEGGICIKVAQARDSDLLPLNRGAEEALKKLASSHWRPHPVLTSVR
jgi:hypothetical protein